MARKKDAGPGSDPNAWMVTFSDLLTLLLTFFVLLISMSSLDDKKLKEAFETLMPIVGVGMMDGPPIPSTGNKDDRLLVIRRALIQAIAFERAKLGSDLVNIEIPGGTDSGFPENTDGSPEGGDDPRKIRPGGDGADSGNGEAPEPESTLEVFADERGLIVRLPAGITFSSGRADLRPEFKLVLESIGRTIKEKDLIAVVEGHTDDRPISTLRFASNWELSMSRAASAVRFLAKVVGVGPERLAASGYADTRPIATNQTSQGRQKNRRVEVILNVREPDKVKKLTDPKQENKTNG
ncbi:MAG: flagellar motor protein MotB [Candidatus Lernaella stagnicola]|nr:flagellar motor protein MotB [Candidatus Lernaella stagnicola]